MDNVPNHGAHEVRVVIDPEADAVSIIGAGCTVPVVGIEQMREVRDALSNHIDVIEAEQRERAQRERARRPEAVRWFDTGSGPGYEVRR